MRAIEFAHRTPGGEWESDYLPPPPEGALEGLGIDLPPEGRWAPGSYLELNREKAEALCLAAGWPPPEGEGPWRVARR